MVGAYRLPELMIELREDGVVAACDASFESLLHRRAEHLELFFRHGAVHFRKEVVLFFSTSTGTARVAPARRSRRDFLLLFFQA